MNKQRIHSGNNGVSRSPRSAYWAEFNGGWRALLAATIGLSAGMSINAYVSNIFAPYLLEAFGWTRSQFALIGALGLMTLTLMPVVGRLTDVFGVKRVATVGIIGFPVSMLLFSYLNGDIVNFYIVVVLQSIFCLSTTTGVYSRVVAVDFSIARGMALAICASGPALVGMLGGPLMTAVNDSLGWRAGYQILALFSAVMGMITFFLLPADDASTAIKRPRGSARMDYSNILKAPVFWILLLGTLLCSFPHALSHSQIKVVVLEHGVTSAEAGMMVSVFAVGVLLGRFGAGIALDRWPTWLASAIFMGLPSIGLFLLATGTTSLPLLAIAVSLLGLSFGGEADVIAYTTAKYFPLGVYSSVVGLLLAAVGMAIGLGSVLLSSMLSVSDSFAPFMLLAGCAVLLGSVCFLTLYRADTQQESTGDVPCQP